MKRLIIVVGFESSGSVFCARVVSYVLGKCNGFGEWNGYGWNGCIGDDLVIIHRSMPYSRGPKKWMKDFLEEISYMENYSREFVICTRDLNISKISRMMRFGGTWSGYLKDDKRASDIFENIIKNENSFIFSFESAAALGYCYYSTLYNWLKIESVFVPEFFDANIPYIRKRYLGRNYSLFKKFTKGLVRLFLKRFGVPPSGGPD